MSKKIYRNTDERFGCEGPFEAESAEALADEMMPSLRIWAEGEEARWRSVDSFEEGCDPTPGSWTSEQWIDNVRAEFVSALEEVEA